MTDDQLDEIRSRINPQYAGQRGTESFERKMLTDEIEALRTANATLRKALIYHGEEAAKLIDEVERNRAAIDELVGVLKASRETLERANEFGGPIADTIWHTGHETLFDFMDAAITKHQQPDHIASAGKMVSERHQHGVFD